MPSAADVAAATAMRDLDMRQASRQRMMLISGCVASSVCVNT
jgi:hypothetical protein